MKTWQTYLCIVWTLAGSGNTYSLKPIKDRNLPLRQLQRITTRRPRTEEGYYGGSKPRV